METKKYGCGMCTTVRVHTTTTYRYGMAFPKTLIIVFPTDRFTPYNTKLSDKEGKKHSGSFT